MITDTLRAINGVTESIEVDYKARGFHYQHTASVNALPQITHAFCDAGFHLEMMTCQDRRKTDNVMRLTYQFNVYGPAQRHLVYADIEPGAPAPSIADILETADWHEREVFDMYGISFTGHPDLKRILMPEDYTAFPLLKDFVDPESQDGAHESA